MLLVWIAVLAARIAAEVDDVSCPNNSYPCFSQNTTSEYGRQCVPLHKVCNEEKDCPLGDDEFYCKEMPRDTGCHRKYVCPEDASCVDFDLLCDGKEDCVGGGDEAGCNFTCPASECECGGFIVRCTSMAWNNTLSTAVPNDIAYLHLANLSISRNTTRGNNLENFVNLKNMSRLKMLVLAKINIVKLGNRAFSSQHSLKYLDLSYNDISILPDRIFGSLRMLRELYLIDNGIISIATSAFIGLESLKVLHLQNNHVQRLHPGTFSSLSSVHTLGLFQNNISEIEAGTFDGLSNLSYLDIGDNTISSMAADSFRGLQSLQWLHIYLNKLTIIEAEMFNGLHKLSYLDITDNFITEIEHKAFSDLRSLTELMMFPTELQIPDKDIFYGLENLQILSADDYRLCCFFEHLHKCNTPPSPFATCEGLLRHVSLRVCIWLIGIAALLGNMFVIVSKWRNRHVRNRHGHDANKVQNVLIINLAVSDFLMGLYMILIGGADAFYGHQYYLHGEEWRNHRICKLAGILSVLSSEASVFLVTFISIDRFLCIVFPFGTLRFHKSSALKAIVIVWIVAGIFSIIPIILSAHIDGFYGLSDVCIGLPLVTAARSVNMTIDETNDGGFIYHVVESDEGPLWTYSIFLFIALNLLCFLIVFICYVAIFFSVKNSRKENARNYTKPQERKEQIKMAIKMSFIVWTDLCCWLPIIIMGVLSQSGVLEIPVETYAWTVVFILPINACLNPYLYTIWGQISASKRNSFRRQKGYIGQDETTGQRSRRSLITLNTIDTTLK